MSFTNFEFRANLPNPRPNLGGENVPALNNAFIKGRKRKQKVTPSLGNIQKDVREILSLVNSLQLVYDKLANTTLDTDEWMKNAKLASDIKVKLHESQTRFFEASNVSATLAKMKSVTRRRLRSTIQRREKLVQQEIQSRNRDKLHEKIESWRESILQKNRQWQREREMKKEADSILAEVRRKKLENGRNLEIITALKRLRDSRKNLSGNEHIPQSKDEHFENTAQQLQEMLETRERDYNAEERALQVILESEQQKTEDKRIEKWRESAERKRDILFTKYCANLYGDYDEYCKYPYIQNPRPCIDNMEAFLAIRHEWDIWASTGDHQDGGGSSIPMGWVQPTAPSSDAWKTALQ